MPELLTVAEVAEMTTKGGHQKTTLSEGAALTVLALAPRASAASVSQRTNWRKIFRATGQRLADRNKHRRFQRIAQLSRYELLDMPLAAGLLGRPERIFPGIALKLARPAPVNPCRDGVA